MAGKQNLRKKQLEEKLGLRQGDQIHSNFDRSIMKITWDIVQGRHSVFDHPDLKDEPDEEWVYFLVVHNTHAAVWAVTDQYLKNVVGLVSKRFVTNVDIKEYIQPSCSIRRYHVVYDAQSDRFYVQVDSLVLSSPVYDTCLYIGTLTVPRRSLDVIMATLAEKTYLLLASDCLEYCKQFVRLYFELIEEEMTSEQRDVIDALTVTTSYVSQASERSGRRNRSSGFSLRSVLTSTFFHTFVAVSASNVLLLFLWRFLKK